jgi:PUB domain
VRDTLFHVDQTMVGRKDPIRSSPHNAQNPEIFKSKDGGKLTQSLTMRLNLNTGLHGYLHTFEQDVNLSPAAKAETLKFLTVILKNLLKSDDVKYRQLRLGNAKIQRMTSHVAVMGYLLSSSIGFEHVQEDGGEYVLKIRSEPVRDSLERALVDATDALGSVEGLIPKTVSTSSSSASLSGMEAPSERQKARMLRDEAERIEREVAREERKRTVHQIKTDKHVRENDPNWKPSVAAAVAKAGDTMSTFRDKFGE